MSFCDQEFLLGDLPIEATAAGKTPTEHTPDSLKCLFDMPLPSWRKKPVGLTTDGSSGVFGKSNGLQKGFNDSTTKQRTRYSRSGVVCIRSISKVRTD